MDLWRWVNETERELRANGNTRLADLIDEIPNAACDGRHQEVEAMVPEALALVRAIDHPWLEVFVRHWLMQSRVLHRRDVAHGLDEVIHLLDFAHGERTRDCPQSVCVTQDVGSAYAVLDGPGYVQERLAVSLETLARIDPTWPCFDCISGEHASALLDDCKFEDAERFCRAQIAQAAAAGAVEPWNMQLDLAAALAGQGRYAEALVVIEQAPDERSTSTRHVRYKLNKCLRLAELGRGDEAVELLVETEGLDPDHFEPWVRCAQKLVELGVVANDAELGATLRGFARTLATNGSLWNTCWIALVAAELAAARGAHAVARLQLEHVRKRLPELRRPERLLSRVAALEAQLLPAPFEPPADLEGWLEALDQEDPERALGGLEQVHAAHPEHEGVLTALADAYSATGFGERAEDVLRAFVARQPQAEDALEKLAQVWLVAGNHQALERLVDEVPDALRPMTLWYASQAHERRGQLEVAARDLERARDFEPERRSIRSRLALFYRRLGRNAEALALLDDLVTTGDGEAGDDDWERMIVATFLGEHAKLRDSAKRLGFEFEGEGPIDAPYAYSDLRMRDERGRDVTYRALRISPVCARIISISGPARREVYRDEVVFEPVPLNAEAAEAKAAADGEPPIFEFRSLALLRAGGYRSYDLDGIHPGEVALQALVDTLGEVGARLVVRSGEAYRLLLPGESEPRGALYAYVAVPGHVSSADLHARIRSHTDGWEHPITFRGLLRELGLEADLARHVTLAEQLGLED